jgi:uncharacterized protein (TIGR00251 family)
MPSNKLADAVKNSDCGVLIHIHVIPNSKEETISLPGWEPRLKVKVTSPPVRGKANEEVRKLFKRLFGNCEITSGATSNKKTLLVKDCDAAYAMEKIETLLNTDI